MTLRSYYGQKNRRTAMQCGGFIFGRQDIAAGMSSVFVCSAEYLPQPSVGGARSHQQDQITFALQLFEFLCQRVV